MLFKRSELITRARNLTSGLHPTFDSLESLLENFSARSVEKTYDVFLSHRYADREAVAGLADRLETEFKLSVYVDWREDPELDRNRVTKRTAELLRQRIKKCKCLWYVTSENSTGSKWMPWETGYMDALTSRVAICPLVESNQYEFAGVEYLALYPYIDSAPIEGCSVDSLWVKESSTKYCLFESWLNHKYDPFEHEVR